MSSDRQQTSDDWEELKKSRVFGPCQTCLRPICQCPAKHTPPPDAQAMTREEFERTVYILSAGNVPRGGQVLAHDAAQRETIARLEKDLATANEYLAACHGIEDNLEKAVTENEELQARLTASEREIRRRMWTLHYSRMQHAPYGDDGRLDCNSCGRDYVATPMDELVQWEMLDASKLVTVSEAKGKWTTARPTVAGWYWVQWPDDLGLGAEILEVTQPHGPDTDYLEVNDTPMDEYLAEYPSVEWQGPLTPGEE